MWMAATEWLDSMVAIRPYWVVRTLAGVSMDVGISLLVYNLMRTALSSRAETAVVGGPEPTTVPVGGEL
jgi:cytochrome c oxidase cbb3-type subunit 1